MDYRMGHKSEKNFKTWDTVFGTPGIIRTENFI